MEVEERNFTIDEAQSGGRGVYHLGQSTFVMPVVEIDGVALGGRHTGPGVATACARFIWMKA